LNDGKFRYKNPCLSIDRAVNKDASLFSLADETGKVISTIGKGENLYKKTVKKKAGVYMPGFTLDDSRNIYAVYIYQNKIEKYSKGFTSSQFTESVSVDAKRRILALAAKRKWRTAELINESYSRNPADMTGTDMIYIPYALP